MEALSLIPYLLCSRLPSSPIASPAQLGMQFIHCLAQGQSSPACLSPQATRLGGASSLSVSCSPGGVLEPEKWVSGSPMEEGGVESDAVETLHGG